MISLLVKYKNILTKAQGVLILETRRSFFAVLYASISIARHDFIDRGAWNRFASFIQLELDCIWEDALELWAIEFFYSEEWINDLQFLIPFLFVNCFRVLFDQLNRQNSPKLFCNYLNSAFTLSHVDTHLADRSMPLSIFTLNYLLHLLSQIHFHPFFSSPRSIERFQITSLRFSAQ